MQTPSPSAFLPALTPAEELPASTQGDDRIYQAVTVLAILMVLGSLWVF